MPRTGSYRPALGERFLDLPNVLVRSAGLRTPRVDPRDLEPSCPDLSGGLDRSGGRLKLRVKAISIRHVLFRAYPVPVIAFQEIVEELASILRSVVDDLVAGPVEVLDAEGNAFAEILG